MNLAPLTPIRYWQNQTTRKGYSGPTLVAVLLKDGTVSPVLNLLQRETTRQVLDALDPAQIAACLIYGTRQGWSASAMAKTFDGRTFAMESKQTGEDMQAAIDDITVKLAVHEARLEELRTSPVARLEYMLQIHDWYACMSDDGGVARAGERHWADIVTLMKTLPVETAREAFLKYAPDDVTCPV